MHDQGIWPIYPLQVYFSEYFIQLKMPCINLWSSKTKFWHIISSESLPPGDNCHMKRTGAGRQKIWMILLRGTKVLFCGCGLKCFSLLRDTNSKISHDLLSFVPTTDLSEAEHPNRNQIAFQPLKGTMRELPHPPQPILCDFMHWMKGHLNSPPVAKTFLTSPVVSMLL